MKLVIDGISALRFYRRASAAAITRVLSVQPCGDFQAGSFAEVGRPSSVAIEAARNYLRLAPEEVLHLVVPDKRLRSAARNVECHYYCAAEINDHIYQLIPEVGIVSPEWVFIEAGTWVSTSQLVLLGDELCGKYRLRQNENEGFAEAIPLASSGSIRSAVESVASMKGLKRARCASRYVLDNAYSPMESILATYLSLPLVMGGMGYKNPILNQEILTGEDQHVTTDSRRLFGDIVFDNPRQIIEYDSEHWHTGKDRIARDAARRNALWALGYPVMVLTTDQAFHWQEFSKFLAATERCFKKRHRKGEKDRTQDRYRLWQELFFSGVIMQNLECVSSS